MAPTVSWRTWIHIMVMTMGELSNSLCRGILGMNPHISPTIDLVLLPIFTPLAALSIGLLLRWGRKVTLLIADVLILCSVLPICMTANELVVLISHCGLYFTLGFNFLAVLLYAKEIPTVWTSGLPLAWLLIFWKGGSSGRTIVWYVTQNVYQIDIMLPSHFYIRSILLAIASLPLLIQLFLLLFVYKREPPSYYMRQCSEDEAVLALRELIHDADELNKQLQLLEKQRDINRYTNVTWCSLCNAVWIQPMMVCLLLMLGKGIAGYYSYNIPLMLPHMQNDVLLLVCEPVIAGCLVVSLFFVDRLSITLQLTYGFSAAIVINCIAVLMLFLRLHNYIPLYLFCTATGLASVAHMLFILLPSLKFIVWLLPDKGVVVVMLGHFLSFAFISYPFAMLSLVSYEILTYTLLSMYVLGSILLLVLTVRWVHKYVEQLETLPKKAWRMDASFASDSAT